MKRIISGMFTILSAALLLSGGITLADETDTLIKLDKKWAEARGADAVSPLLSDDVMGVSVEGTSGERDAREHRCQSATGRPLPGCGL